MEFIEVAERAARGAGEILIEHLGKLRPKEIEKKRASDFVTFVDRASEERIIQTIKEAFPNHRVLAEESSPTSSEGDYLWIIDPLDGTTNYIHSYPMFAISIALQFNGETI
ncbi:MAG: inositol monophosphatase, partial [Nitrospirae bacterium]